MKQIVYGTLKVFKFLTRSRNIFYIFYYKQHFCVKFQLSSSEIDHSGETNSIDLTLGSFSDAAGLFSSDLSKQFIGITPFPTTPVTTRPMPPLAYPNQPKQPSTTFNSNGVISSSVINSNNRPYNNNNININSNNNNPAVNNVTNYQQKTSASSSLQLAQPPQSRPNTSSVTTNNNNPFVRPSDSKSLMNGRTSYSNASQLSKHEVSFSSFS